MSSSASSSSSSAAAAAESAASEMPPPAAPGASDAADKQAPRPQKIRRYKYAILMAYCGAGYQGFQKNLGAQTIEDELLKAFLNTGMIRAEDDAVDANLWVTNSFSRVARTDKGVHAAGQVVALRLRCENTEQSRQEALDKLNAELPPTIRCLWIQRMTKGFDARHAASARHYEYLLPTRMLRPRENGGACPVSKYPKTVPLELAVRDAMVAAMRAGDPQHAESIREEAEKHLLDRMGGIRPGHDEPAPSQIAALHRGTMRGWAGRTRSVAAGGTGSFSNWTRQLAAAPAGPAVVGDVSWVGRVMAMVHVGGKLMPVCLKEALQPAKAKPTADATAAATATSTSSSSSSSSAAAVPIVQLPHISPSVVEVTTPLEVEKRRIAKKLWKKVVDVSAIVPSPQLPKVTFAVADASTVAIIAAKNGCRITRATRSAASSASASSSSSSSSSSADSSSSMPAPNQDWLVRETGSYMTRGETAIRQALCVLRARNRRWGYRIDGQTLAKLREGWSGYLGSHSFHNFTPHLLYGDSQAHRTMRELSVSEPFLVSRTGILPGMKQTDRAAAEATMKAMLVAKVREHKMARRRRLNRKRMLKHREAEAAKVAKIADTETNNEDEDEDMEEVAETAAADAATARASTTTPTTATASSAAAAQATRAAQATPEPSTPKSVGSSIAAEDDEFEGVDATTAALEAAFAKHDSGMSSLNDKDSLRPDFIPVTDEEVEEARRILDLREPPADLGLLTQEDLEQAGPDHAMEFVRFTVIGQSFLLNQIRHMVGLAVEYARGACNRSVLTMAFSNCNGGVPLAPAEGLFLHNALFQDFNRHLPAECQPLTLDDPVCLARQMRFKEQFIWAHIARQCAVDQPFERWRRTLEGRPFHYRFRKSATDLRTSGGAVSRAAISLRQHRMATNTSSASRRGAKGSVGIITRGRGRGRTDRTREMMSAMNGNAQSGNSRGGRGRGRGSGRGRGVSRGRGRGGRIVRGGKTG